MPTYKGPYSPDDPDFKKAGDNLNSYPTRKPNVYGLGPPDKSINAAGVPFGAIDCSGTIDPQVKYGFGFDDNKGKAGNWSGTKSDDGLGGFSGDTLPRGRAGNHPTRSSKNAR